MQQFGKGVLGIQVLGPIGNIVSCDEDLGNRLATVHEELIPETHQFALTDGSQSLDLREVFRAARQLHVAQGDSDGAGRDDDDFVAIFLETAGCFYDCAEDGEEGFVGCLIYY